MAKGFRRRGRGDRTRYAAQLDSVERQLLVSLIEQVVTLLDPDGSLAAGRAGGSGGIGGIGASGGAGVGAGEATGGGMPGESGPDGAATAFDQIVAGLGLPEEPGPPDHDDPTRPDRDDPAVARLLPSGNLADEEAAAEFRRFTEDSLRWRKVTGLRRAARVLGGDAPGGDHRGGGGLRSDRDGRLELGREDALALLVALTDVRLVLASRLGVETDADAELLHEVAMRDDTDAPTAQGAAVYDFLTWLQETLASCLVP